MSPDQEIINILRREYPHLISEYGVKRLGLFGSYAQGHPTESSDIDILVEFDRPLGFRFVGFTEYLETLLGKPVDVLTPAGVQSIRIDGVAESIEEHIVYV
ncbi:MAG TPA: nucleotidyltransferase family protein [bacterium]|nr:nucleotidyltransferase family protein [bacterium]HPO09229.1 nucleotidyltransferase family protein [bacterium]HQP97604.1 nucleotidyltransferase family protein [bacterium]